MISKEIYEYEKEYEYDIELYDDIDAAYVRCVVLVCALSVYRRASLGLPRACEIWAPALRVRHATQATPNNASYRQIMSFSFPGVRFKRGSRS